MKLLFIMLLNVSLGLQAAKNMGDLGKNEQQLVNEFVREAKAKNYAKAELVIEKAKDMIAKGELSKDFKLADLFTAYYPKKPFAYSSFLVDFCLYPGFSEDRKGFYQKIVNHLVLVDTTTHMGESPLSMLAKAEPMYSLSDLGHISLDYTDCARILLDAGADPLFDVFYRGEIVGNPLSYALINYNQPMIELLSSYVVKKHVTIPLRTQELLRAYRGEVFKTNWVWGQQIDDLFRVANQAQNYGMVQALIEQIPYLKEKEKKNIAKWQAENINYGQFYYPPLWAMNMISLKDYARKIAKEVAGSLINQSDLKPIKKDLYSYRKNGEEIVLLKKPRSPQLGRILGASHLKEHGRKVARKFFTLPSGLEKARFIVTIPGSTNDGKSLQPGSGYNPVNLEIEGMELYGEYIEGAHEVAPRGDGFIDNDRSNAIRSKKDGELYIIDTGDDKNFIVPMKDTSDAYQAKSLHFAPHIRKLVIDLSK